MDSRKHWSSTRFCLRQKRVLDQCFRRAEKWTPGSTGQVHVFDVDRIGSLRGPAEPDEDIGDGLAIIGRRRDVTRVPLVFRVIGEVGSRIDGEVILVHNARCRRSVVKNQSYRTHNLWGGAGNPDVVIESIAGPKCFASTPEVDIEKCARDPKGERCGDG